MKPTKTQKRALDFIVAYIKREGMAPTYAEIAAGLGLRSRGHIASILNGLCERDLITLGSGPRAIQIADHQRDLSAIPAYRLIAEIKRRGLSEACR
jgi:SOS-response transcriptional repressor LexA